MVYIKKWPEFQAQCVELYQRAPAKTRYLIKAEPSQSWLVLKVTDDETCLKFRTRSSIILNRFEAFTRDLTATMAGLPSPSALATAKDVEMKEDGKSAAATAAGAGSPAAATATASGGATGGGGGKKKKKKGGKK